MSDEAAVIRELIESKSTLRPTVGTFVSWTLDGPVVDIGTGRILAAFGTSYLPEVGERVLVWFIDGRPWVMGPAVPRPSEGTVKAVSSNRVTLATAVGDVGPIPYVGSAPAVGTVMRLLWHGGAVAISPAAAPIVPPAPPAPPAPAATAHVDTFSAIQAGSWNTGGGDAATSFFNSEVWASNTTIGLWFYGSKIPDTIPAGASIQRVQLYIAARQIQGGDPRFTTHGYQTAPGSPAVSGGVQLGVGNYSWLDLPTSFGDALKRGGGQFGIATRHGGYNIFKGLAADGQSGTLVITSTY